MKKKLKEIEIPDEVKYFFMDYIFPLFSLKFYCRALASIIVIVLVISAIYSLYSDATFLPDITEKRSWMVLFERQYFKDLFFSPLWILSGFLFAVASKADYREWKEQRGNLLMYMKDKTDVKVIEIQGILMDGYDAKKEYRKSRKAANKMKEDAARIAPDEQKV